MRNVRRRVLLWGGGTDGTDCSFRRGCIPLRTAARIRRHKSDIRQIQKCVNADRLETYVLDRNYDIYLPLNACILYTDYHKLKLVHL